MSLISTWWEARFLRLELLLAYFITLLFLVWSELFGGKPVLAALLEQNRGPIYGTLASILGALLGFVITAVSIVLGYATSDRLAVVAQSRHYSTLWATFASAIRWLGFATATALIGLALDRDGTPRPFISYIMFFAFLIASLRIGRCAWILEHVVRLVTKPPA